MLLCFSTLFPVVIVFYLKPCITTFVLQLLYVNLCIYEPPLDVPIYPRMLLCFSTLFPVVIVFYLKPCITTFALQLLYVNLCIYEPQAIATSCHLVLHTARLKPIFCFCVECLYQCLKPARSAYQFVHVFASLRNIYFTSECYCCSYLCTSTSVSSLSQYAMFRILWSIFFSEVSLYLPKKKMSEFFVWFYCGSIYSMSMYKCTQDACISNFPTFTVLICNFGGILCTFLLLMYNCLCVWEPVHWLMYEPMKQHLLEKYLSLQRLCIILDKDFRIFL